MENAPNLTILDADNNQLTIVPSTILNLKNIKTLNVANNSINNLPPELSLLEKLNKLSIEGNPLISIKSSLRTGSTQALKKYLKSRYLSLYCRLTVDVENVEYQKQLQAKSEKSGTGSALYFPHYQHYI